MDQQILQWFAVDKEHGTKKEYKGKIKEVKFNKKQWFVTLDYYDEEDILFEELTFTIAQILADLILDDFTFIEL